jgi:dTDP-glucose 4,6-dehydratase
MGRMSVYDPRNLLITGSAGFIGGHFVQHMLRTDPQVRMVTLALPTYAGSLTNLQTLLDPLPHKAMHALTGRCNFSFITLS